jgi:transcriptional regulator with XRE-family HTH domain
MNEMQQIYINIGKRIRNIRKSKKMTLEELAFEIDMDYSFIARIETGKATASLETLYKISKGLKIKFYQLFNEINPKKETYVEKEFLALTTKLSFEEKEKMLSIMNIVLEK